MMLPPIVCSRPRQLLGLCDASLFFNLRHVFFVCGIRTVQNDDVSQNVDLVAAHADQVPVIDKPINPAVVGCR